MSLTSLPRILAALCGLSATSALAKGPQISPPPAPSNYDKPPKAILDVLHAPTLPNTYLSPLHDQMLLVSWEYYPSMARVATPFLKLAGVRVEPANHSRHDTSGGYGIAPCALSYALVRLDGSELPIPIPPDACFGAPYWSADGKRFAIQNTSAESVELWLGDPETGKLHRIPGVRLNPMLGDTVRWLADQRTLIVKLLPSKLGAPPIAPPVPIGPDIQETDGQKGESSTYEARDTLKDTHDEDLFDYYVASQLALVDVNTGKVTRIGKVGAYDTVSPAPDGEHIRVDTIQRPYSYVVTVGRFPYDVDIWNRRGAVVHHIASLPLADRVPIHGVPTGPRDFFWRANEPASLMWVEALDQGDWNVKVPHRDRLLLQRAPFRAAPVEVARLEQRFASVTFAESANDSALLREYDENRHWIRTFVTKIDDPSSKPDVLWDLSWDERYKDPGQPVMRQLPKGPWVLQQDGSSIFLSGGGASPSGDRPFLDRLDLATRKTERLFRSAAGGLDRFVAFVGRDPHRFLSWDQSPRDPPNVFLRTLGAASRDAGPADAAYLNDRVAVTHVPDPTPQIRDIKKRLVTYKRKDGVSLSFELYLPPGYKEGTLLPAVLEAYPLDYSESGTAGQVTGSDRTFNQLYGAALLTLAGYAVIDAAAFPIVGDPKTAYDTYLDQLLADAQAAVDQATGLGMIDRERIGVTGHSHGALMTANLVAHSDLFRAGVATSGAYNKTLTPFGFQSERRSLWEGRDVYFKVSPFFSADKLRAPLLLMHGEDDANPGTTPFQATAFYEAIRGNGGTARLVMLPHEPHSYTAMESNEQMLYEMVRWFDKYVKNAAPRTPEKPVGSAVSQPKAAH